MVSQKGSAVIKFWYTENTALTFNRKKPHNKSGDKNEETYVYFS